MKIRIIGLAVAFSFLGFAVCLAADPQVGTWKLNELKSKIMPDTLKNTQVVYSSTLGQVKVKSDGIDANGKPIHVEWSGKLDGKIIPFRATRIQTLVLTRRLMIGHSRQPTRKMARSRSRVALSSHWMAKGAP